MSELWSILCCYNGYVAILIGDDELSVDEIWSSGKEGFWEAEDGEDER